MNLLDSPWLSFKSRDGRITYRAPSAIVDPEVVELAMPRADFQGAAYQWLIGLLQTALVPEDHYSWFDWLESPPDVQALEAAFAPLASAFELDGEGPRFMQDLDPLSSASPATVSGLLIDAPGANGVKNNTDLFIKRGRAEMLCADCAAMALFTLQINAPSGGVGYRVGLRGGGPLSTLVLPDKADASLWRKLWLNVLPASVLSAEGRDAKAVVANDSSLFAWMGDTPTSEKKGSEVLPESVHPLHAYWAMPRRYRLLFEALECCCDLCGREATTGVRQILAKNYGMNYGGPWLHPFTPYRMNPKKPAEPPLSTKGQPGGVGYRHWSHLVFADEDDRTELPAAVVHDFLGGKYNVVREEQQAGTTNKTLLRQARLWAFGYDMDNMKPRCWYSVEMPLVAVPLKSQTLLREWVQQCVEIARHAAWMTRTQVKNAWFERPKDVKGDMSDIDQQFYEATQPAFFTLLRRVGDTLAADEAVPHLPAEIARDWYRALRRQSLRLFDERSLSGPLPEIDMKRVVRARQHLLFWWRTDNKKGGPATKFAQWGGIDASADKTNKHKEAAHD